MPPARKPHPSKPKRKRGKPSYVPTEQDAAWVRNLVAGAVAEDRIARMLGISAKTLRKHYRDAIRVGQTKIDAISVSALVTAMTAGGREGVLAAIWWQRSRMGWAEKVIADDTKAAATMRVIIELVGDAPKTIDHDAPRPRPGLNPRNVELVG